MQYSKTFENADGSPAVGSLTFVLEQAFASGDVSMTEGSSLTVQLDQTGSVSLSLPDGQWRVSAQIVGSFTDDYVIYPSVAEGAEQFLASRV